MSDDLTGEIHEFIHSAIGINQVVSSNWIAQEIFRKRPDIFGNDKEFYEALAWDSVRAQVRKAINRWKAKPEHDEQLVLPGYRYLQQGYMVERDDGPTVVPLQLLTDGEILARVAEYQRMADGCTKHAEELMGYYSRRHMQDVG